MNKIQQQKNYKQSLLNKERLVDLLEYSPETGVFTWKYNSKNPAKGKTAGTSIGKNKTYSTIGIKVIGSDGKRKTIYYLAHRLAWLYITGEWPTNEIDHIDGNGLNNKIANLRQSDRRQNMRNQKLNQLNKSGKSGVRFSSYHGKWLVKIGTGKRGLIKHIGVFDDFFDAVCARKSAENLYKYHANHGRVA